MKKIATIASIVAVCTASIAFAVTAPTNTAGVGTFGTTYMRANEAGDLAYAATNVGAGVNYNAKLSANVYMSLQSATDGSSYVAATFHGSGNKYYATSSGDSRIFMKEITEAATAAPSAPPTLASPVVWTGWTAVK